ncbi:MULTISPECIES: catalase [unclassified Cupriavidus]|uniref:catalase n=1 Tax=Cupriavidus sp. H19C3 TaxID=3241603 RepID=UPI003BF7A578
MKQQSAFRYRMTVLAVAASLSLPVTARTLTRDNGAPVGDNQNSQTAGPSGPTLLQDVQLIEKLQRFGRERIPERVVHARGTAAEGDFVAAGDFSDLTAAKVLSAPGKRTPVVVRFSTVVHPSGSPETVRDPRGFATKFYTEEGNWDLVANHTPIFFIRDAIKFPDMIHSLKPSPVTNLQDPNRFFDFFSHVPESTHMLTRLYSDFGIPASYRMMPGNGVHAFKLVNARGEVHYAKFEWRSHQGEKYLTRAEAAQIQSRENNNLTRDLYEAIARGDHPRWDLYAQILKPSELDRFDFDPLDSTKVWPDVPSRKLGTMTLNKVPDNFFETTELSAFAPSNLVPGIEPSEDRMLQGRLFSYADTQIYRLGANYLSMPVNRPHVKVNNYNQDGAGNMGRSHGDINYQPSRAAGAFHDDNRYRALRTPLVGSTQQERIRKTANFRQAGDYYRALSAQQQENLIGNLAADLGQVRNAEIRQIMLSHFYRADADYGKRLAVAVKGDAADAERRASQLVD